jgi:hypothetical protein
MGWLDDLANKVGISSRSLGLNTAEDKAAREKEAADKAYADSIFAEKQAQQDALFNPADIFRQDRVEVADQQPGMLSQAYQKALEMAKGGIHSAGLGIGGALGNKDLMNLAGAGLTYGLTSKNRDAAEAAQNEATNLAKQVAYLQDPTVAQIQDDAANKAYLAQATKGLADRAAMGLTPEELADIEKIRNQQNQAFQAQQTQIQENMARRGMGNSGLALAQTMGASQQAGQQAANNATELSSQMFQAKQNALGNLANTAGQALTGQFNRDVTRAKATDAVNEFNVNQKTNATTAQRQQALDNVTYQQNAAAQKANSLGKLTSAGTQYLSGAFGQKKDANGKPIA